MKILVTGANGYLGQGIVRSILNNGHCVVATDFNTQFVDERAERIACNLFEVDNPYSFFGEPDVLLHLAWRDGFVHYSSAHIDDLPKHYAFIKKMVDGGIQQVAVMGTQMICKQKNIVFQWLRGYYIVGNSKFGSSIFSKITAAVDEGKTEFPFTLGQNQYDFIDYSDFCAQVAAVVGQKNEQGIINICSGKPEKLADRVERFIKENGYRIKLQYGAFPDRPYDSKAIWGNDTKIRKIMENQTN